MPLRLYKTQNFSNPQNLLILNFSPQNILPIGAFQYNLLNVLLECTEQLNSTLLIISLYPKFSVRDYQFDLTHYATETYFCSHSYVHAHVHVSSYWLQRTSLIKSCTLFLEINFSTLFATLYVNNLMTTKITLAETIAFRICLWYMVLRYVKLCVWIY